jgi:hypothetical protein
MKKDRYDKYGAVAVRSDFRPRWTIPLLAMLLLLVGIGSVSIARRERHRKTRGGQGAAIVESDISSPSPITPVSSVRSSFATLPPSRQMPLNATSSAREEHDHFVELLRRSGGVGRPKWNTAAAVGFGEIEQLDLVRDNGVTFSNKQCFEAGCSVDLTTTSIGRSKAIEDLMWSEPMKSYPGPKTLTAPIQSNDGRVFRTLILHNADNIGNQYGQ